MELELPSEQIEKIENVKSKKTWLIMDNNGGYGYGYGYG